MGRLQGLVLAAVFAATLAACGSGSGYSSGKTPTPVPQASPEKPAATARATESGRPASGALTLTSDAFTNNSDIPPKYSCSGGATSPALAWTGAPAGTQSFTLMVHDPDAPLAGGFTHWIVVDLPGTATTLPAAVPAGKTIAGAGTQLVDYRGMCPPAGAAAHHYHFRLYALDGVLGVAAGQTKDSVEAAMQGHILAQTDLVGLFAR